MTALDGEVGYSITVEIKLIVLFFPVTLCVQLYKRSLRQRVAAQARLIPPGRTCAERKRIELLKNCLGKINCLAGPGFHRTPQVVDYPRPMIEESTARFLK
jgi:hypothetical protein